MSSAEGATHRGRRAHDQRAHNAQFLLHGKLRFNYQGVCMVDAKQNVSVQGGSIYAADSVRQVVEQLFRAPSRL